MTDQQMHQRLLDAGARWRDAQPTDLLEPRLHTPRIPYARRQTAWLLSAAAIAAAVVGLVLVVSMGRAPRPIPPGSPPTIEGIRWTDPGISYDWPLGSHPQNGSYAYGYKRARSLRIDADGRVTGFDGCAAFTGHARVTDRYIVFGPLTRSAVRPCTNVEPAQEALIIDRFLTGRVHWRIICQRLWLITKSGEIDYGNAANPSSRAQARCMQRYSKAHS